MTDTIQNTTQKSTQNMTKGRSYPKSNRLLKPAHFSHVFDKTERKLHATHLMAFVRSNELSHPRLGLAITKKKVPTAVGRNRLKRIARDKFRLLTNEMQSKDIVIIAKRPIDKLTNEELHREVQQVFQKLLPKVTHT